MKNFLPFMLIKAVLTAAIFGGISGVPRGIAYAESRAIAENFELYSNNQIFLLNEDTLNGEITAFLNPSDTIEGLTERFLPNDNGVKTSGDLTVTGYTLSGTSGTGNDNRNNVDISNAGITLATDYLNYVCQITLDGRAAPEITEEPIEYLFYVSSGTKISNLKFSQILKNVDLTRWWLINIQLHVENRPKTEDYYEWEELPLVSAIPINTQARYFRSRYAEVYIPTFNYLDNYNPSLYYNTSWGVMTCGNARVVPALPTTTSFSSRGDQTFKFKVGSTARSHHNEPEFYGIPKTFPANSGQMFVYGFNTGSVIDTSTLTEYPAGAVFESPIFRFTIIDFFSEQFLQVYTGEPQDDDVYGNSGLKIAAFDLFRFCCEAEIIAPPSPEPEPEPKFKSDFSTWQGSLATFLTGAGTFILTGIYVVPSVVAGIIEAARYGASVLDGVNYGLVLFGKFFKESWNTIFDVIHPVMDAVAKVIDWIGDFFKLFIEKVAPIAKSVWEWFIAFIGNYWYVILPAVIAIIVAVQIQKNRRR